MADGGLFRRRRRSRGGLAEAFRLLFDAAPEGMALLDREGRIRCANPALGALAGPALPIRAGLPAEQLLVPAAREALARRMAACLEGVEEAAPLLAAPVDPLAPEGSEWSLRCRAVADPEDGGPGLLLQIADRSPQRRMEAQIAAMGRLETVGRLAGGIAHDFNNLLTAILGSAAAMRRGGLSAEAAAELQGVEDAAQRGAALVRQLLAFARQQRLQSRILDLNEAVSGIAPLLGRLLGARIELDLALEIPGRRVRMDPAQLDQVILNLAVNAREAMPEGGRLRIATRHAVVLRPEGEGPTALPPGRYAVLEVSDTGCGIPPDSLPRLFEPFYTTRPDKGGTGLGLATVQGIVIQSGGHIAVESQPGRGSTFRIHLPRQEGPAVAVPPGPAAKPPAAASPAAEVPLARPPSAAGPARVLLVEDEAPLRRLATLVLQRAGHEVLAADCAEAALDLLEDAPPPAALVSDVAMPGMDGLELARALRARWPDLPILLLSGYAESALGRDFDAEGLRFLAKPYTPEELLAALDAALEAAPALAA
jgi:two-component system cell cycle sensor histidine kinase/response regulator CckA